MNRTFVPTVLLLLALWCAPSIAAPGTHAADCSNDGQELAELLDVEVVTAMRRPEPLNRIAGAVTVLDEEDIRRSGALSIPDLLRLVPGLHVSHMDADKWAVGARGFNGLLSNSLLVLVDGRPVTSPNLSGVFWSSLNLPLDDIARVEVVRGPSTSLWSLDSFNGVVSIMTKHAADTRGVHAVTTVNTNGDAGQTVRVGGPVSDDEPGVYAAADDSNAAWRVGLGGDYADGKSFSQPRPNPTGGASQQWRRGTVSTRVDWTGAPTDAYSFQGGYTASTVEEHFGALNQEGRSLTRQNDNGYGQFVWDRATGVNTGWNVRSSYTRARQAFGGLDGVVNAVDMEVQHLAKNIGAHSLMWGAGIRHIWDEIDTNNFLQTDLKTTSITHWSAFGQDLIGLLDDRLQVTLGLKADGSDSNVNLQPTLRMNWCLGSDVLWAAISRSVRSPGDWRRDGNYEVHYDGRSIRVDESSDLKNEKLTAWEAGWRSQLEQNLNLDVSLFFNDYEDIVGINLNDTGTTASFDNVLNGHTWGVEAALSWDAMSFLTLRPSLSWIAQDFKGGWVEPRGDNQVIDDQSLEGRLQVLARLSPCVTFDTTLFFQSDPPGPATESMNMDTALSWEATQNLRLELLGKNLLGAQEGFGLLEEDSSAGLRITWDF